MNNLNANLRFNWSEHLGLLDTSYIGMCQGYIDDYSELVYCKWDLIKKHRFFTRSNYL